MYHNTNNKESNNAAMLLKIMKNNIKANGEMNNFFWVKPKDPPSFQ